MKARRRRWRLSGENKGLIVREDEGFCHGRVYSHNWNSKLRGFSFFFFFFFLGFGLCHNLKDLKIGFQFGGGGNECTKFFKGELSKPPNVLIVRSDKISLNFHFMTTGLHVRWSSCPCSFAMTWGWRRPMERAMIIAFYVCRYVPVGFFFYSKGLVSPLSST